MPRRIVLISDLQQGSRLDALGDFEWPSDVELDLKTVADDELQRGPAPAGRPGRGRRVRKPTGTAASGCSTIPARIARSSRLEWTDAKGAAIGDPIEVYVPPGESRVVARAPTVRDRGARLARS